MAKARLGRAERLRKRDLLATLDAIAHAATEKRARDSAAPVSNRHGNGFKRTGDFASSATHAHINPKTEVRVKVPGSKKLGGYDHSSDYSADTVSEVHQRSDFERLIPKQKTKRKFMVFRGRYVHNGELLATRAGKTRVKVPAIQPRKGM
jgi:hypothetical protein